MNFEEGEFFSLLSIVFGIASILFIILFLAIAIPYYIFFFFLVSLSLMGLVSGIISLVRGRPGKVKAVIGVVLSGISISITILFFIFIAVMHLLGEWFSSQNWSDFF